MTPNRIWTEENLATARGAFPTESPGWTPGDDARRATAFAYWFHAGQAPPEDASLEDLRVMVNFVQWRQLHKRDDEELVRQRDEATEAAVKARLEVERLTGVVEALLTVMREKA